MNGLFSQNGFVTKPVYASSKLSASTTYGGSSNSSKVQAPLIRECYANLECKLVDTSLAKKYSLFVFEVVKIHAALSPKNPKTIHYQGKGQFMVAGPQLNLAKLFRPGAL